MRQKIKHKNCGRAQAVITAAAEYLASVRIYDVFPMRGIFSMPKSSSGFLFSKNNT